MPAKKSFFKKLNINPFFVVCILFIIVLVVGVMASYRQRHEVTIGFVGELSGGYSGMGQASMNGVKLAVKQLNDVGGIEIDGTMYTVNLLIKDGKSDPSTTAKMMNDLADDKKVLAIVGPSRSEFANAAATVAQIREIPLISPYSTDPASTRAFEGSTQYLFRATVTIPVEVQAMANYVAFDMKKTKAAVLFDPNFPPVNRDAQDFMRIFEANGGKIVANENYIVSAQDFSTQLKKIKATNPDVLFLPNSPEDIAMQTKQARALGMKMPIIAVNSTANPIGQYFLDKCGEDCDGVIFPTDYSATNVNNGVTASFIEDYQKQYFQTPNDVAALSYDSVGVLAQALSQSKKVTREALQNQLVRLPLFEGVTGNFSYNGTGDPLKGITLLQVRNGKFVFLKDVNNPRI